MSDVGVGVGSRALRVVLLSISISSGCWLPVLQNENAIGACAVLVGPAFELFLAFRRLSFSFKAHRALMCLKIFLV
jgi:hypothetical protein